MVRVVVGSLVVMEINQEVRLSGFIVALVDYLSVKSVYI